MNFVSFETMCNGHYLETGISGKGVTNEKRVCIEAAH